jgi:hypothetical protein
MKYLKFVISIPLGLVSCNQHNSDHTASSVKTNTITTSKVADVSKDKQEIQNLIRETLQWADSKRFDLLPTLMDSKDSTYVGFDLDKLRLNLEILKKTDFFSVKFIENYNQIILTLDKKFKNKEFGTWSANDLPVFHFANDVDPWCLCQDNMSWNAVEVKVAKLNSENGELYWTWGGPELNGASPDWKDFSYKFDVEKENGKWKISYLQGFDFEESVKKDGI